MPKQTKLTKQITKDLEMLIFFMCVWWNLIIYKAQRIFLSQLITLCDAHKKESEQKDRNVTKQRKKIQK